MMKFHKKTGVECSKRGAYLQMQASGKRASVVPNKKRKAARRACRGNSVRIRG